MCFILDRNDVLQYGMNHSMVLTLDNPVHLKYGTVYGVHHLSGDLLISALDGKEVEVHYNDVPYDVLSRIFSDLHRKYCTKQFVHK